MARAMKMRRRRPAMWAGRGARPWVSAGDLRIMVLGGLFLGLISYQLPEWARDARWAEPLSQAEAPTRGGERVSGPVRVIDGDTFAYRGDKIRIADIDTPETHPPRCAYEANLGAQATERLEELLGQGPFEMHKLGSRDEDRYGRKLRVVTRGGKSIGDMLVAEGLARTWTGRRQPWCT